MKALIASLRAILLILNTLWQMSLLAIERLFRKNKIATGYKHRRIWARNGLKILGITVDEQLGDISAPVALIVSNHRTLLDPIIQVAYFDAHIIAKESVSKLPVIAQGAKMTGIFFVKREKLSSRAAAKKSTQDLLKQNINVLVYAEGTTGTESKTLNFKIGTFAVASELNIPVIPVAVEYQKSKDYWYEGGLISQMIRQVGAWHTHAKLRIGPQISDSDPKQLLQKTKKWIDQNLSEMQVGWSEVFKS